MRVLPLPPSLVPSHSPFLLPLSHLLLLLLLSLSLPHPSLSQSVLTDTVVSAFVDNDSQLPMSDLTSAYLLQSSTTTFIITKTSTTSASTSSITAQLADFALISSGLSDAQAQAYPNLAMYPIAAYCLTPIYRLDALDSIPLTLTRTTLAQIYAGNLTWWNDSRIQAVNPAVTLPGLRISMVLPQAGVAANWDWTTALGKFWAGFNHSVQPSIAPSWPTQRYAAYTVVDTTSTAQAAAVIATDGSIGYASLHVALHLSTSIASLINKAGTAVMASQEGAIYAAVELGTQPRPRTTDPMDLTDASSTSAWPIVSMSFLLLDTQYSRGACDVRRAVVDFWLWFYSSSVASRLLGDRGVAQVPSIVLTQLDVVNALSTGVYCRGLLAEPTTAVTTRLIGAPVSVSFLAELFASLYGDTNPAITWKVQRNTDNGIMEQMVAGELDVALINPVNVDPTLMAAVSVDPDYFLLPTFLTALAFTYNLKLAAGIDTTGYQLTLDMRTMGLLNYYCILYWNDPIILQQNPWLIPLVPSLADQPLPITQVQGCGTATTTAPIAVFADAVVDQYVAASGDTVVASCKANRSLALAMASADCLDLPAYHLLFTTNEDTVPALVQGTYGAMGQQQADGDTTSGVIRVVDWRDGVWRNTSADIAGELACASDTFDAANLAVGYALGLSPLSHDGACWRGTQQVMAIVRTSYLSARSDASGCVRGYDALTFLQWFYSTPAIDVLVNSEQVMRVSSVSTAIYQLYIATLNTVTCDAQTLLVTMPIEWTLAAGIRAFVIVIASMGLIGCIAISAFVWHSRHHPVVRSASPLFLLLSVTGVALLFVSGYLLVSTVTPATCTAFSWLVNFGLMLTFAPLFAKTWRIYRIFGRKKLSVVVISNRRLLVLVAVMLGCELLLLATWQWVGNLQPITNDVTTSSLVSSTVPAVAARLVVDEYVQCGVSSGAPRSLFAVICVEKGLLFVFGALMAFTTRKVTSSFNESAGITLAIYNTCFTVGIITPIILVISATGDVLTLLLAFALLWIAAFTTGILFVPKVNAVLYHTAQDGAVNTSIEAVSSSKSGYQFLSLAALSALPTLLGYQAALERHLAEVQKRVAQLRKGGGRGDGVEHKASVGAGGEVGLSSLRGSALSVSDSTSAVVAALSSGGGMKGEKGLAAAASAVMGRVGPGGRTLWHSSSKVEVPDSAQQGPHHPNEVSTFAATGVEKK